MIKMGYLVRIKIYWDWLYKIPFKLFLRLVVSIPLILFTTDFLFSQNTEFRVKYLSSEFVYIDAGTTSGLAVGDQLTVTRAEKQIAVLEIVFTASHSSSCKIIYQNYEVQVNDNVVIKKQRAQKKESRPEVMQRTRERISDAKPYKAKKPITRITGNVSLQNYWHKDLSGSGTTFYQPAMRLKVRGKNLWDRNWNFRFKFRSRYNEYRDRQPSYFKTDNWQNQLYELSLSYDDLHSPVNFKVGRILSNQLSGIGYIDGLLVRHHLSELWGWGIFAGSQPEWQYNSFQTSYQKYGTFIQFTSTKQKTNKLDVSLSAAGIYHGSSISREFFYLRANYIHNSKWRIYNTWEIDVNRDWRKERSNETFSISGSYFNGQYQIYSWLSGQISYDSRKNYRYYETRSLADSLFDDALRQGLRLTLKSKIGKEVHISSQFGFRKRESEKQITHSYWIKIRKQNMFFKRTSLSARYSVFQNYYSSGWSPTIRLGMNFRNGTAVNLDYGAYYYNLNIADISNTNYWSRVNFTSRLPFHLYLIASYQYDWGDNRMGQRVLSELVYHF